MKTHWMTVSLLAVALVALFDSGPGAFATPLRGQEVETPPAGVVVEETPAVTPQSEAVGPSEQEEAEPDGNDQTGAATGLVTVRGQVFRMGSDYTVAAGDRVEELVIISGVATVDGEIEDDLVVMVGGVDLSDTAVVGGDVVVIGGDATIASGADIGGDVVVLGGTLDSPPDFAPGGEQVVTPGVGIGEGFRDFLPFVGRGLLWGRLIVPDLGWIWGAVALFLVVYLGLNLIFDPAIRVSATTIADRPLSTLLAGLLALLLIGPVSFLLTVSLVGLVVVPFLWCAFVVAGVIGKVAVFRWIGASVLRREIAGSRLQSALAVLIGFGLATLAYMVPVLGLLSWATLSSLGLGAAAIAFIGALRQENPAPPAPPAKAPPPPNVPPPPAVPPTVETPETPGGAPAPAAQGQEASGEAGTAPAATESSAPSHDPSLFPRASFWSRLGAFALDIFLTLMTFGLVGLDGFGRFILLFLVYEVGFWSWKGATVGGIVCQFRIVRINGTRLEFSDALIRGLSSIFSLAAAGLGCLWVLWDAERQAWHDKIAATYVVQVPRNWPS